MNAVIRQPPEQTVSRTQRSGVDRDAADRRPDRHLDRRLCIAPMMDWTDRHCRYFHRQLAPDAMLYSEMVTTGALLHGDREGLLRFNDAEHPVALQLGGCEPSELARCAEWAQERGYDEVNLNVGCPSDRVQRGRFGACLMLEAETVSACLAAMQAAVDIPVTVKTRLGVDDHDSYDFFGGFVDRITVLGCRTVIVHARKAWLSGLSPKENREVPELRHEWVHRLKQERSDLEIIINGGVTSVRGCLQQLEQVDGVMLGRAAYQTPWLLRRCQRALFGAAAEVPGRAKDEVIAAMTAYIEAQSDENVPVRNISRHMLGLFQGEPGAKRWRRHLSEHAHLDPSNTGLLVEARSAMRGAAG